MPPACTICLDFQHFVFFYSFRLLVTTTCSFSKLLVFLFCYTSVSLRKDLLGDVMFEDQTVMVEREDRGVRKWLVRV